MREIVVCLDNTRSAFNVGSIMRTCSFFGVKKVILLGYSGKHIVGTRIELHPKVLKTALGSEKDLEIIMLDTVEELGKFARDSGYKIVSFEQTSESVNINKWQPDDKTILVFGNEVEGVRQEVLAISEAVVEIPRAGKHNSLNVEVTAAIGIFKASGF